MAVFKKIHPQDISIIPFNVHKDYTINSSNYTGSNGYGVNIMRANDYSHSFGDPLKGIHIKNEVKNPNGIYNYSAYHSINHLYYSRLDKPSENFGNNLPEKQDRTLKGQAHVISIPSPLYDLKIKSGSFRFTDDYLKTMVLDRFKQTSASANFYTYQTAPLMASRYRFEASKSKFKDSEGNIDITHARGNSILSSINILSGSIGAPKVGTGSILFRVDGVDTIGGKPYNAGHGLQLRNANAFAGIMNPNWWEGFADHATNNKHGMPAYTVTMWVKPPDYSKMRGGVTNAPGQSTILTRDKNSYFELNLLTSSLDHATNPKGLVPLQMFWGATGSNCTTSESRAAAAAGFGLATGSWNLVTVQQQFWPDAYKGTSGSRYQELPPWGHSPAKTTLRIYRPDPNKPGGYTIIKKTGYATASRDNLHWTGQAYRAVTSSVQYNRHMLIGASGSVKQGAANNNPNTMTQYMAFTGSMDDVRFYEDTLTDLQISDLYHNASLTHESIPTVTASFDLYDDGYGNIIDRSIPSSSFPNKNKLIGYYGFNELYHKLNHVSSSDDVNLHKGLGKTLIQDFSIHKNTAISDKVKFTPGIALFKQSGSARTADSINFYQSTHTSGIRAQFYNSGSIRIPHHDRLNLNNEDGFAISFWIKIPENQIPSLNTIIGTDPYPTIAGGDTATGGAGGTREDCTNVRSGSAAGRDYLTILSKRGHGLKNVRNAATDVSFTEAVQGRDMERTYPYHIELKNTSYEKNGEPFEPGLGCPYGAQLNTIVVRRKGSDGEILLESATPLAPLVDNHIVIQSGREDLQIWINGTKDKTIQRRVLCPDNTSDVFIGDEGRSWSTGSDTSNRSPNPVSPLSGSVDELRFYDTKLSENEILSLYDNSFLSSTAYQSNVVGNLFYGHGIATLTNTDYPRYFVSSSITGDALIGNNDKALFSDNFKLKFKNTRTIYEQKIKCVAKSSDFNLTINPTARKTVIGKCDEGIMSVQELADFAKDPSFNPYVTTIGLYDDFGRLLAIGKLGRPIQKLQNVDMTFVIKFDI